MPATQTGAPGACGNARRRRSGASANKFWHTSLRLMDAICIAGTTTETFCRYACADLLPRSLLSFGDYRVPSVVGGINVQKAVYQHERIAS